MKNFLKIKKKRLTLYIVFLAIFLAITAFAWLLKEDTIQKAGISNFVTSGEVYFLKGSTRIETEDFVTGGLIKVNLYDENADNFIGNLRVNVIHKGFSPCYLRVRVLEQWIDEKTEEIMQGNNIPYIVENVWYDNRQKDLCFYYNGLYSTYNDQNPQQNTIPLIKGVNNYIGSDTGVSLYLTFKIEAIQPNRVESFWGLDKLPFEN